MSYHDICKFLQKGKTGMLPHYEGYFHWDYFCNLPYMKNGDYITYDLDNIKDRMDFIYII